MTIFARILLPIGPVLHRAAPCLRPGRLSRHLYPAVKSRTDALAEKWALKNFAHGIWLDDPFDVGSNTGTPARSDYASPRLPAFIPGLERVEVDLGAPETHRT